MDIDVRPRRRLTFVFAVLAVWSSSVWGGQVETNSYGSVIGSKVRELCGVGVARAFPQTFVGDDVVELSRLLGWTVVCDDVE